MKSLLGSIVLVIATCAVLTESKSIVEFLNLSEDQLKQFSELGARCRDEHKTDPALIADMDELKFAEDPSLKCYIHCLSIGFHVFHDGGYDLEQLKKLTLEKDHAMATKCSKRRGVDACDKSYKFYKCLMVNFHK